jgi:large-conductance mechanosensitive channel
MFNEIPELDKKGLRDFGLITGALFAGIFGLLLPWQFEWQWPIWPWIVFAVLAVMAIATPMQLRPIYRIWMRFGLAIGSVISRIILGLVFFLLVTPLGIMMRATGKDPMNRQLDSSLDTYREPISEHKSNSFDKPF